MESISAVLMYTHPVLKFQSYRDVQFSGGYHPVRFTAGIKHK